MTTYTITETDLQDAVEQLKQSGRGVAAMKSLVKWLDSAGLGLDAQNQDAVLLLLQAAWGPYPGTARDLMRAASRKPRQRHNICRGCGSRCHHTVEWCGECLNEEDGM